MAFETSSEMFINMKSVPKWNPLKSYYDQTADVLQFYEEERYKITHGVNIGGFHVHPWLYFHINHFKTPIPVRDNFGNDQEIIMTPPLDDNMFYTTETYQEAKEKNKIMFVFGTRGGTKSVQIVSLTQWTTASRPHGKFSIMGGSAPDLKAISSLMETAFNRVTPAFYVPTLKKDWNTYVEFGYKEKSGFRMTQSEIFVTNAVKGNEAQSEKGAGLSPIGFVIDECGKFSFKSVLDSALPSFKTPNGWKLVPYLSGTGGNNTLSKDAKLLLSNPEAYDILPMNWDRLNRHVPEEFISWSGDTKSKFGTFVPGHMTYREKIPKLTTPFSDYVGIKHKDLDKIKIKVTDWASATEVLKNLIDKHKNEDDRNKNRMYYPRSIMDCFLTESRNPFPTLLIDKRLRELKDENREGKRIEIYKDANKHKFEFSSKKKAEISHPGGNVDAPIVLFGDLPEYPPEKYMYISGLDDYKLDVSDTDSLGSFYILKRRNLAPDEPCERIVACYTSRPERHSDFHRECELMSDVWNAECLMEAVDISFKQHLELKGKVEQYLAPSITFSNTSTKRNPRLQTTYGLYPTAGNNEYRLNLAVEFTKERYTIGIDEFGNEIVKHGVDYIDDIDLLEEMYSYRHGGNFDRLTAFSHALVQCRELDKKDIRPKSQRTGFDLSLMDSKSKPKTKLSPYTINSRLKRY